MKLETVKTNSLEIQIMMEQYEYRQLEVNSTRDTIHEERDDNRGRIRRYARRQSVLKYTTLNLNGVIHEEER